mgnify:CR=1 FL=1
MTSHPPPSNVLGATEFTRSHTSFWNSFVFLSMTSVFFILMGGVSTTRKRRRKKAKRFTVRAIKVRSQQLQTFHCSWELILWEKIMYLLYDLSFIDRILFCVCHHGRFNTILFFEKREKGCVMCCIFLMNRRCNLTHKMVVWWGERKKGERERRDSS